MCFGLTRQQFCERFHTFVANRLAIIHDGSTLDQWKFVETKANPADYATREMTAKDIIQTKIWFNGPMFLWKPEEAWPLLLTVIPEIPDGDPEVKKSAIQSHTVTKETDFMYRVVYAYSCFERLKKAIA